MILQLFFLVFRVSVTRPVWHSKVQNNSRHWVISDMMGFMASSVITKGHFLYMTNWGMSKMADIFKCILLSEQFYCALTHGGRDKMAAISQTIFSNTFFNDNIWISIKKIQWFFVPQDSINNFPTFLGIMALRRTGDKPFYEAMVAEFTDAYMRHSASVEFDPKSTLDNR